MTAKIMEILVDHFPQAANIQFEDAGPCPDNATGVLHVVEIDGGANSGQGYDRSTAPYVSLDFETLDTPEWTQEVVLHEFMHALGFAHEFDRLDFRQANYVSERYGSQCAGADVSSGITTYTPPDLDSILVATYCHDHTVLSAGDVAGLSRSDVYGSPGVQHLLAFSLDSAYLLQTSWWTGSTWAWSPLPSPQLSGSPNSVVASRSGDRHQIHIFSLTSPSVNLAVQWWDGFAWNSTTWTDKQLASSPSAVVYRDYGKGPEGSFAESPIKFDVFGVDTAGGNLLSRHWDGSNAWSWIDYGTPDGTPLQDVSAVSYRDLGETDERFVVFARRADSMLEIAYGLGGPSTWTGNLGGPNGGNLGPITSLTYRDDNQQLVYLWTTSGGHLWTYYWNGSAWNWADLGTGGAGVGGDLAATSWTVDGVRWQSVYSTDSNGDLWECEWNGSTWRWVAHGKPSGVSSVRGQSVAVIRQPETQPTPYVATPVDIARYVFVRGNDQKLYVRWTGDNGTTWTWADQTTPYWGPDLGVTGTAAIAYWSR